VSPIITARGLFTFKDSSHGHWRQEILKIQQTTNPAAFNIYEVKIKLGRTAITHTELRGPSFKVNHPLYVLLPKVKESSSKRLRSKVSYHGLIQKWNGKNKDYVRKKPLRHGCD